MYDDKDLVEIMDDLAYGQETYDPLDGEDRCPVCGVTYNPEPCLSCNAGAIACACGNCDNPRCEFGS